MTQPPAGITSTPSTTTAAAPATDHRGRATSAVRSRSAARTAAGLSVALIALAALATLSLVVGSNPMPMHTAVHLLFHPDATFASTVIHQQRIPRTLLVITVGAALGVAGALMQAVTSNPLADPGILGVNAGASLAVVLSVAIAGVTGIWFYLWFAFIGAAIAAIVVYILGGAAHKGSHVQLALAGAAVTMAISSVVQIVVLTDQKVFNEFRLWAAGSVENRGWPILAAVAGFIIVGLIIAQFSAPGLNALALGVEQATSLGVSAVRIRASVMIAVTLLAGAATAAVGPIMFVGLGVPFAARAICGPDNRRVVVLCAVLAPVMLLAADIIARVVVAPQEIQTGIIASIIGGPFFIAVVRRTKFTGV